MSVTRRGGRGPWRAGVSRARRTGRAPRRARKLAIPLPASTKKILVVDDDADLRAAVAASIADLGVEVLQARDGVEGLAHLAGEAPSAILLDMRMPRLDGDGFLRALRGDARLATIPVITMTGGPDPVLDPLVASHLHKPFDPDELARILVSLCEVEPGPAGEPG